MELICEHGVQDDETLGQNCLMEAVTRIEAYILDVDVGELGIEMFSLQSSSDGEQVELPPDNVLLPKGCVARLVGLTSDRGRSLAGRFCAVGELQAGRYVVSVSGEAAPLTVRPRNLWP